MREKTIWEVVWTHKNGLSVERDEATENVDRFATQKEANDFCAGKRNHGEWTYPVAVKVPSHIAKRWGF